tara:strand:- start:3 stop:572 length:570 start_codon:yes stop_codon:yes gene_type:complete
MADVTKISGVAIELITKIGSKAKSDITKIGPKEKPAAGPTCTSVIFGYNDLEARTACSKYASGVTATYYHDETNGTLYSDSCGGTEALDGYYANGDGYRQYTGGTLSGVQGACRSDRRVKQNILFKQYSKSGIPIYEFEYINESDGIGTYVGTMAQDLIKLGKQEAVTMDSDGYYSVYYDKIDVDFRKV